MFTKCNGFIVSGDPLVYADSATMTGQGTVSEPFGVKSTDLFVQEPLYTGTSGNSAYIGWNNETVLWTTGTDTSITSFTLTEPISAFDRIRFKAALFNTTEKICGEIAPDSAYPLANISFSVGGYIAGEDGNPYQWYGTRYSTTDGLTYNRVDNKWIHMTLTGTTFTYNSNDATRCIMLREIIGINRKA